MAWSVAVPRSPSTATNGTALEGRPPRTHPGTAATSATALTTMTVRRRGMVLARGRLVVAGDGRTHIGECVEERLVAAVDAVGQGVVGRDSERRCERRPSCQQAQLDVDDVIAEAAPVREPLAVAIKD